MSGNLFWIYATAVVLDLSLAFVLQNCACPGSCPDGWVQYRGSCYYMFESKSATWLESTHHCELHQAYLVTIDSKEEDLFLRSEIKRLFPSSPVNSGQEFWIGATDTAAEGSWVWYSSNSNLSYTDWYPGQPGSDGVDEDCAVIAASTSFIGWHDAPCGANHHPLCEINNTQQSGGLEIIGKRGQVDL